jgi:hypothetical protein
MYVHTYFLPQLINGSMHNSTNPWNYEVPCAWEVPCALLMLECLNG